MASLLRLGVVRSVAFRLIDANLFRHPIEERLKREYIARERTVAVVDVQPPVSSSSAPEPMAPRTAVSGRRAG